MLFLFDANVPITASNTYYPLDQIPEFWSWTAYQASIGNIKMPLEVYEEVLAGSKKGDPLVEWMKNNKDALVLDEPADPARVQHVFYTGYGQNLTEDEVDRIGRDPFLISYALGIADRCVVTVEGSAPSKQRANRKVPDVCNTFGIQWANPFSVYRALGFKTSWKP